MNYLIAVIVFVVYTGLVFFSGDQYANNLRDKEELQEKNVQLGDYVNKLEIVNRVATDLVKLKRESEDDYQTRLQDLENVKKDITLTCRNSVNGMRAINSAVEAANKRRTNATLPITSTIKK